MESDIRCAAPKLKHLDYANTYVRLPVCFTDFHKCDGLTGLGDIPYGFVCLKKIVLWNMGRICQMACE